MLKFMTSLLRKKKEHGPSLTRLVIVRHGHSLPAELNGDDFTRELSHRGQADVEALGAWLAGQDPVEKAFVSTATRAQQSYMGLMAGGTSLPDPWTRVDALYYENERSLEAMLTECSARSALVLGHNPTLGNWLATHVEGDADLKFELQDLNPADCVILQRSAVGWHVKDFKRS